MNDTTDITKQTSIDAESINGAIEEFYNEHRLGRSERPYLSHILLESLECIEKLAFEGQPQKARYRFAFEDGESLIVDTETLYSPTKFRRAYGEEFDVLPRFEGSQEDWEDLLYSLKRERMIVKTEDLSGVREGVHG